MRITLAALASAQVAGDPLALVIQVGDPEVASYLRIEERELETGGPS